MNNKTQVKNSENDKHREVIKQQLRAMANSGSASSSNKVLSADSMIEDLLSKKETFQRKDNKNSQNNPPWLMPGSDSVHPIYECVWAGVQSNAPHLADTQRLSTLLMTSGLSTDVLGFIWSLANHTVVGALTQQELYVVLALVALAQSGYAITTTAVLNQLPQPPLPKLEFSIISLPTISFVTKPSLDAKALNVCVSQQSVSPIVKIAPLSASSLLDAKPVNSLINPVAPSMMNPGTTQGSVSTTDHNNMGAVSQTQREIGISYVSNHMFPGQASQPEVSFMGMQSNMYPAVENVHFNENQKSALNVSSAISSFIGSSNNSTESTSSYNMSSEKLSSKLTTLSPQNIESKLNRDDDDFTDFQTADFKTQKVPDPVTLDDEEFTHFQSVSINSDLFAKKSNIKESNNELQKKWAIPTASASNLADSIADTNNKSVSFVNLIKPSFYSDTLIETSKQKTENEPSNLPSSKYNMDSKFQETDLFTENDDKYNIFHNPLPELLEDKYSVFASLSNEEEMNFSNFIKAKQKEDIKDSQTSVLDLPKIKSFDNIPSDLSDDEYSDFHSFDFTKTQNSKNETQDHQDFNNFKQPTQAPVNTVENTVTKMFESSFDMFNTSDNPTESDRNVSDSKLPDFQFDMFQKNFNSKNCVPSISEPVSKHDEQFANFENGLFISSVNNLNIKLEETSESFSDFMSAQSSSVTDNINLTQNILQDQTENKQNTFSEESAEDKYSALRILEPVTEDIADDFGEFLEANTKNSFIDKPLDETFIQLRCLEACLTLLEAGVTHLSAASNREILAEVLSDPRALHYLDCLQEVNRVSERILTNIDTSLVDKQKSDLEAVREKLAPYFAHCQHSAVSDSNKFL